MGSFRCFGTGRSRALGGTWRRHGASWSAVLALPAAARGRAGRRASARILASKAASNAPLASPRPPPSVRAARARVHAVRAARAHTVVRAVRAAYAEARAVARVAAVHVAAVRVPAVHPRRASSAPRRAPPLESPFVADRVAAGQVARSASDSRAAWYQDRPQNRYRILSRARRLYEYRK
mmetsp:Transcript_1293/g.3987  ORF Transcript_1293/g.3987 Transcript_1293/m.3987 type:complete len:180 (+) Transcript_1293:34-573(+)